MNRGLRPPPAPPGALRLGTIADVDLWRIDLDLVDPEAMALLSPDEQARAARFAFEHLRRRFVAGRATVRRILGAYLALAPAALTFGAGAHGKPSLAGGPPFSFSRSGGCGLLGVGSAHAIGVDLERLRDVDDAAGIAASTFTTEERAAWLAAGGDGRAAFLRVWTRKEARLKALGVGLSGAGSPAEEALRVVDIDCYPEHAAALAIAAP